MKPCVIIPARLGSTRLPGKPLADINGKPMIVHVVNRATEANVGPVFVATPDDEIVKTIQNYGGVAIRTPKAKTGTDRVLKALNLLEDSYDIIVNLQGDCPTVDPRILRSSVWKIVSSNYDIVTAVAPLMKEDEQKTNIVKAYLDGDEAVDFSRKMKDGEAWHHLGLYVYGKVGLRRFCNLPQSKRELDESLEQLRALDNEMTIGVIKLDRQILNVDVQHDLELARKILKNE